MGGLTSDLSLVSDWDRANIVLFNASKNFYNYELYITFQITIPCLWLELFRKEVLAEWSENGSGELG